MFDEDFNVQSLFSNWLSENEKNIEGTEVAKCRGFGFSRKTTKRLQVRGYECLWRRLLCYTFWKVSCQVNCIDYIIILWLVNFLFAPYSLSTSWNVKTKQVCWYERKPRLARILKFLGCQRQATIWHQKLQVAQVSEKLHCLKFGITPLIQLSNLFGLWKE